ncbi:hypothetical protein BCF11_3966 [Collimonas sp. PA-H2]|nr:hypothetical protein BCF11_3966 [Collimonas sp. PA-H2]
MITKKHVSTTLSSYQFTTIADKKFAYLDQGQGFPLLLGTAICGMHTCDNRR